MRSAPTLTLATLASALASERKVSAVQRLGSGLTLTLLLATPSRAGWVSHGPEGGTMTALGVDSASPSTAYAGTVGGGGLKTTDGGGRWGARGDGPPAGRRARPGWARRRPGGCLGGGMGGRGGSPPTPDCARTAIRGGRRGWERWLSTRRARARSTRGRTAAGCSRRRTGAGAGA